MTDEPERFTGSPASRSLVHRCTYGGLTGTINVSKGAPTGSGRQRYCSMVSSKKDAENHDLLVLDLVLLIEQGVAPDRVWPLKMFRH
jgi:hypothetical protein